MAKNIKMHAAPTVEQLHEHEHDMYTIYWTNTRGRQFECHKTTKTQALQSAQSVANAPWCNGGYAIVEHDGKSVRITRQNARFWLSLGYRRMVKVTLVDGDSFAHTTSGRHEEGWWSITIEISYDQGVVTMQTHSDGTDCDGRLYSCEISQCDLAQLRMVPGDEEPNMLLPAWTRKSNQRDYSAEAAGY